MGDPEIFKSYESELNRKLLEIYRKQEEENIFKKNRYISNVSQQTHPLHSSEGNSSINTKIVAASGAGALLGFFLGGPPGALAGLLFGGFGSKYI